MTKKYEIVLKYIKDLSVEIPDAETFIFSRDLITKYSLGLNITTKAMKNNMIEVITKLSYRDPHKSRKKSYFEILYASVVKINDILLDGKSIGKDNKKKVSVAKKNTDSTKKEASSKKVLKTKQPKPKKE